MTGDATSIRIVEHDDGRYTVVAGLARGQAIRQYFVRGIDEYALDRFEHDLEVADDNGEDVELVISAWSAIEGG